MSHEDEAFCFHSSTRLQIELAMLTVHQHGVRILTFTDPDKLLILAHLLSRILPVRSLLEHSKDLWIAKSSVIVDFDPVSGQPGVPPRALDVHGRTDVTFSVPVFRIGLIAEVRPCIGARERFACTARPATE
jgi:hypothetical protein